MKPQIIHKPHLVVVTDVIDDPENDIIIDEVIKIFKEEHSDISKDKLEFRQHEGNTYIYFKDGEKLCL